MKRPPRKYRRHSGQFRVGPLHPRYRTDEQIIKLINERTKLGTLRLTERVITKEKSRRYVEIFCISCKQTKFIMADSLLKGGSRSCICQRARKYPNDRRADLLGNRYDSMIQRCYRTTHCSSHNYKGRGIRSLFEDREDYIRWALDTYPNTDFVGLDFDRIDNDGHYSKENLRLVPRRVNMLNTRRSRKHKKKLLTTEATVADPTK